MVFPYQEVAESRISRQLPLSPRLRSDSIENSDERVLNSP
ncbi:hypothetical protein CKA32_006220 [Geitlerinema sp. FC II]|nr:hypothetical protein CKA32_006220 [Geitlerinema sp. FC II]